MHTLTKIHRSDLAYQLLLQHQYPSWLYSVDQGATTIWERWNGYTVENGFYAPAPHNNSFNHYSYGSVVAWMFRGMAGISYDEKIPGFKHMIIKPQPDKALPMVQASYDSIYGTIVSNMRCEEGAWHYEITVPANTTATIILPANGEIQVDGQKGLTFVGNEGENAVFYALAGSYSFYVGLS